MADAGTSAAEDGAMTFCGFDEAFSVSESLRVFENNDPTIGAPIPEVVEVSDPIPDLFEVCSSPSNSSGTGSLEASVLAAVLDGASTLEDDEASTFFGDDGP
jgi:hypothetical protein